MSTQLQTAEVIIVGAGIMGASIAYHLATMGIRDVVVIERDQIASGATAAAAGGIRVQFSTATNIRLSLASLEVWEHFEELFGVDISFRQQGYLFLLTTDDECEIFRANLDQQQQLGAPVRWVDVDEIRTLNPYVQLDDVTGGTFGPRDGWADTSAATMGFINGAKNLGVRVARRTPVTGICVDGDRVTGVETSRGRVASETVIIAAGPQSRGVGSLAGVDIPIDPVRRMSFVTGPFPQVSSSLPMTIEFGRSLYIHPEGPGFLFGMSDPNEPPSSNTEVDSNWMLQTIEALSQRMPVFEDAGVLRGWAGSYEVTPDDNAILGPIEEVRGLYVAAGFSGHGFMHGPAVGKCIAELVTHGAATTVDISTFSPGRFARGGLSHEHHVI